MHERTRTLGRQLRYHRSLAGYTIRKAAVRAGVTPIRLSQWERDVRKPGIENLARLAVAYNVLMDELCLGIRARAVREIQARLSQNKESDKPP